MTDNRVHRALIGDEQLEFITDLHPDQVPILNSYLNEAEEFGDDDLLQWCRRFMKLRTSIKGKRAELVADVGKHEEQPKRQYDENLAPPAKEREPERF